MAITKLMSIKEKSGGSPSKGLENALKYITNPEKTDDGRLVRSHNTFADWQGAYGDMCLTKKLWKQEEGMQGYHFVISFPPKENVPPELALEITRQFLEKFLGSDYEALYSAHTDQKHMHTHIVFNSVSRTNGKKYHYAFGDWRKIIQPIVNGLCEKYHLQTVDLNWYRFPDEEMEADILKKNIEAGRRLYHTEWEEARKGFTWAQFAMADIDSVLPDCNSFEDVVKAMQEIGWEVKWKTKDGSGELAHFAIRPPKEACDAENNHNWIRPDKKCGYGYTREGIEERIRLGLVNLDDIEISDDYATDNADKLFSKYDPEHMKTSLTDFQRKFYSRLYRTGEMARRKLNEIPMEYRVDVRHIKEMETEVNILLNQQISSSEELESRIEALKLMLMKAGKDGDKKAEKKIKRELAMLENILNEKNEAMSLD